MEMHPELKRALDANVSALDMIEAFTEHHSGALEEEFELYFDSELWRLRHYDSEFWDAWQPVVGSTPWSDFSRSPSPSEIFLSIHKGLTREIISWLCDSKRTTNVYLIAESQIHTENQNENCRANAFATICHNANRLGQPLRHAPWGITSLDTLSTTLAAHYPPLRRILTEVLVENPEISKLPIRTRFKKLILEPWKELQKSHPQYIAAPPVIVFRCWDEPDPEFGADDLLPSICEFASQHISSLLWIISFNPKLKLPTPDLLDPFSFPRLIRPPICYEDARADTELFLSYRFYSFRRKHERMFDEHEVWPSEEQISHLTRIFSGTFDSIDVVFQFIDWEEYGGPRAHLETFLAYMFNSPSPSDEEPCGALDHFYTRIFSHIPAHLLSVVKRAIGIMHYGPFYYSLTPFQLACLSSVAQDTILDMISHLYRWAVLPYFDDEAVVYGTAPFIGGFLEDAKRSGRFYIQKSESMFSAYQASLHIVSHFPNFIELLRPAGQSDPKARVTEIKKLKDKALSTFCCVGDADLHAEWTLLRHFDFRCLSHIDTTLFTYSLFHFLERLYAWDKHNSPHLVRVEPAFLLDRQFIDKCEGIAEPLVLENKKEWHELGPVTPKYVLLGLEAGTVLVVLASRRYRGPEQLDGKFTIYTSAMLEYM